MLVLVGVIVIFLAIATAKAKGRSGAKATWFSVLLGPFALVYYAVVPSLPQAGKPGGRWGAGPRPAIVARTWWCDACHCTNAMTEAMCCSCGQRTQPGRLTLSATERKEG